MNSDSSCANALRFLAIDAVQRANSGHPGMPMGMADIATVLWQQFLQHDPSTPNWFNRDRFIVSNGHGAMLHYALLHLSGYDLSIDDLKNFRQLNSKTPGHPEYGHTPGVETTTGPLGQGLANAVGMAIAEKTLAAQFNRPGFHIVDHHTYALVGDGCLMEGISHEVCSLAGTLGLGKLIVLYDDNGISIDGDVTGWFTDNTPLRFEAYGWQVIPTVDGHDPQAIAQAIAQAQANTTQPTLICCQTTIGFGSPNLAGQAKTHGAPLGDAEIAATREHLQWPHAPFEIPAEVSEQWNAQAVGAERMQTWAQRFAKYETAHPQLAAEFLRRQQACLPKDFATLSQDCVTQCQELNKTMATRKASQHVLNQLAPHLPELMGGSADLTGSNCTAWQGSQVLTPTDAAGNYIEYGVREFGMSAIMNGLALHGGFIPYGGTFLVFADYARNAVRLSALMQQRVIYVYTHDSIGLGEDGPTHQPIEHVAMLRLTPGLSVWRPCDMTETAVAWQQSLLYAGPSCLLLSRQNLPAQPRTAEALEHIAQGGYVLADPDNAKPQGIFIATGSEVSLAQQAAQVLAEKNIAIRVVSIPNADIFKTQSQAYQQQVLPPTIRARVAIEAASPDYWHPFVGEAGQIIGLDQFGLSAPAESIFKARGLTVDALVQAMQSLLSAESLKV